MGVDSQWRIDPHKRVDAPLDSTGQLLRMRKTPEVTLSYFSMLYLTYRTYSDNFEKESCLWWTIGHILIKFKIMLFLMLHSTW